MGPDERELDEEIRGHIALSVKERVDRGESVEAARRAALSEFGYIPAARESMRQVWHSRGYANRPRQLGHRCRSLVQRRQLPVLGRACRSRRSRWRRSITPCR